MAKTMRKGRTALVNSLPRSRGSLLFLAAFTLFYAEDFNIFSNNAVSGLCFGGQVDLPFSPLIVSLLIALVGFLVLMVLYRWRFFAISEGRGLVVACGLIVGGPLLWMAAQLLGNPLWLQVAGLSLVTFGHLCFLPAIVKNLAEIGVAQSLVCYACVMALSAGLRPLIQIMPGQALLVYLLASPVAMLTCLQLAERDRPRRIELRKDAELRVPRTLLVTMFIVGAFAGLRLVVSPGDHMDRAISNTVVLVVSAAVAVYIALFRKMNFNRLIYLICIPIMAFGLVVATFPGGGLAGAGGAVYLLGFNVFYAVLWALYSYLVRYSSFNYYWLPVTAAVGTFAGRFFSVSLLHIADAGIVLPVYLPFIVAVVCVLALMVAIHLCSQNNMKSGWGSIAPGNDDFILDSFERNCSLVAKNAGLTPRENDVLLLLARGRNCQFIAEKLFITEGTAKTHIKHVYRKVGVHSQQELIDVVEQAKNYD